MRTVAFCEIDPYCRRVLARRWPGVPIHGDVRELTGEQVGPVDVICGGFPCQDISRANPKERDGVAGKHSGLWSEFSRLIRQIRPRFVIVENVPELLVRGMGTVIGDLAAIGYDAEWDGIPCAALGSNHLRARQWILAYPCSLGDRLEESRLLAGWPRFIDRSRWSGEPGIPRVDDGLPDRMDRRAATGNTVHPGITEAIGRCIMTSSCLPQPRQDK